MTSLFFIERAEDIGHLKKYYKSTDQLIALTPQASVALTKNNFPHRTFQDDFYQFEKYSKYCELEREQFEKMINYLNQKFLESFSEFKNYNILPFKIFNYYLFFNHDVIKDKYFKINEILNTEKPDQIKFFYDDLELGENSFRFADNETVFAKIFEVIKNNLSCHLEKIDVSKNLKKDQAIIYQPNYFKVFIKRCLSLTSNKIKNLINKRDNKVLSIGCPEIESLSEDLKNLGTQVEVYLGKANLESVPLNKELNNFFNIISKDVKLQRFLTVNDCNLSSLTLPKIKYVLSLTSNLIPKYKKIERYFRKNKYQAVFFFTHTPFNIQNVLVSTYLSNNQVPQVCWIHGGCGVYYKNPGFEQSDFLFAKNYIVFGNQIKKHFSKIYENNNINFLSASSPRLIDLYKNYTRPKNTKKKIVITLGPWQRNNYYFVENIPENQNSFWNPNIEIIKTLKPFADKYDIILRPSGNPDMHETLHDYLESQNITNFKMIKPQEKKLKDLYFEADLIIFTWVSTTFWEGALTDCDLFVLDQAKVSEEAFNVLNSRAYYIQDYKNFNITLTKYLEEGNFYQKSQNTEFLEKYFINKSKDELAENVLTLTKNLKV